MYSRWFLLPIGLLAAIAVLIVIVPRAVAFFTPYAEAQTIGQGTTSFQEISSRFQELARRKGAVYAFEVLKRAPLPPDIDTHLMGHVVGDILYQQKGVDGIEYCTQDFRNACSHSIVIGTLNEFGPQKAVPLIRDACKKAPGGSGAYTMCFHGLGHGVLAYFQYDLGRAVAYCKQLGTPAYHDREYIECVGGGIMELIDGGGHDHEDWVKSRATYLTADPLSPCTSKVIPNEAKPICFEYLTPRLFELAGANVGNPDPEYFPKAFSFCDQLTDPELKHGCFGSFGKEFIPLAGAHDIRRIDQLSDDDYLLAVLWCALAPTRDGQDACMAEALDSVFWGGENDSQASFRLCSLVKDTGMQSACYDELAVNISQYTSGERQASLCGQLPAKQVRACGKGSAASP